IESSSASNQCIPVTPALCDSNHSRIASASRSASDVISTRNVMLSAQVIEHSVGGSCVASFYIFQSAANAFQCVSEIPALPLEICSKGLIECSYWILTAPFRIFIQLCLTFRFE